MQSKHIDNNLLCLQSQHYDGLGSGTAIGTSKHNRLEGLVLLRHELSRQLKVSSPFLTSTSSNGTYAHVSNEVIPLK